MNNTSNNKEERILVSLSNWWFAGLIVFTYWLGKQLLEINGEHLEWLIYIFAGGFTILYYLYICFGPEVVQSRPDRQFCATARSFRPYSRHEAPRPPRPRKTPTDFCCIHMHHTWLFTPI